MEVDDDDDDDDIYEGEDDDDDDHEEAKEVFRTSAKLQPESALGLRDDWNRDSPAAVVPMPEEIGSRQLGPVTPSPLGPTAGLDILALLGVLGMAVPVLSLGYTILPALAVVSGGLTVLIVTLGVALGVPSLLFALNPPRNVLPGMVPPRNPLPGTFGGGASPQVPTATSGLSLSLVPIGRTPVSLFPPFVRPRRFPAAGAIFSEDGGGGQQGAGPERLPERQPIPLELLLPGVSGGGNQSAPKIPRTSAMAVTSMNVLNDLRFLKRNLICFYALLPRNFRNISSGFLRGLRSRFQPMARLWRGGLHKKLGRFLGFDLTMGFNISECLNLDKEPLYGFNVLAILVREPCTFGMTCDTYRNRYRHGGGRKRVPRSAAQLWRLPRPGAAYHHGAWRPAAGWSKAGLPTRKRGLNLGKDGAEARQTGEEFMAAGSPSCRIVSDPTDSCRR